jgi:hypothetical protein
VPCSASRVVPGAHRVVGPGTHRGSGPREVHTTGGAVALVLAREKARSGLNSCACRGEGSRRSPHSRSWHGSAWVVRDVRRTAATAQWHEAARPFGACGYSAWRQPGGPQVSRAGARARHSNQRSQACLDVRVWRQSRRDRARCRARGASSRSGAKTIRCNTVCLVFSQDF